MTAHQEITAHAKLVEEVATAVQGVPGVAFLRPGLADRLRSAPARPTPGTGGAPPAGVRMTRPDGEGPWYVEIHVVALRRARTLDVARLVRSAVEHRLDSLVPAQQTPRVTVTVTGLV
ncbi:hypothetical protein [Streptomyces phaeochromogenes]|uniref:Asp23/Gls24 family envelope stress response protein n=1 Tax=Streptomyces phaeochromogenes TaxID=1923 RepID=A0ABZ1HUR8_STRPH|nr:hypothetical protein [Streptomyces phaeochromogenes]WSD21008.1 hypothetical protein OHB35_51520 [Streptomyces phaeochromogenes]WSJ02308.1 hypothetical protein OG437_00885 [Streptomyces phaeochromogenes]